MRLIPLYCSAFVLVACGREFPREISIDDRFTRSEMADIRSAVAEVNKLGELIGEDRLIEISGTFHDGDGRFGQDNIDDGCDELYRCGTASDCLDFVRQYEDEYSSYDNLYGFYTGTDIGLMVFNIDRAGRPLKFVAMHELGHFVGMLHVTNNRNAVMHANACCADSFTAADREEFCLRHGCDPD